MAQGGSVTNAATLTSLVSPAAKFFAIVIRPLNLGWLAVIFIKLLEEYYQADTEGNS